MIYFNNHDQYVLTIAILIDTYVGVEASITIITGTIVPKQTFHYWPYQKEEKKRKTP